MTTYFTIDDLVAIAHQQTKAMDALTGAVAALREALNIRVDVPAPQVTVQPAPVTVERGEMPDLSGMFGLLAEKLDEITRNLKVVPPTTVSSAATGTFTLRNVGEGGAASESTLAALEAKDFATQTTLAAVLAAVDGLEAKDYATQATLAALEAKDFATQTTLAAVLAAVDGLEGQISTLLDRTPQAVKQFVDGQFFASGGKQSVALSATGILQIRNPPSSGKRIQITQFGVGADVDGEVQFVKDATVTTPTTLNIWQPNRLYEGAVASIAEARRGGSGYTGGTLVPAVYPVKAFIFDPQDYVVLLGEGQSISATFTAAASANFYATATWVETPI